MSEEFTHVIVTEKVDFPFLITVQFASPNDPPLSVPHVRFVINSERIPILKLILHQYKFSDFSTTEHDRHEVWEFIDEVMSAKRFSVSVMQDNHTNKITILLNHPEEGVLDPISSVLVVRDLRSDIPNVLLNRPGENALNPISCRFYQQYEWSKASAVVQFIQNKPKNTNLKEIIRKLIVIYDS